MRCTSWRTEGVGRGEYLDANLWCPLQGRRMLFFERRRIGGGNPRSICYFDAIGCYDRRLRKHFARRQVNVQQLDDPGDMARVIEKWWRTHKDAAQAICLNLVRQLGQLGISPELFPASEMLF